MALSSKAFSELINFTRSSEATRFGPTGLLERVPADQPRFDYDPVTLEAKGLLIEPQRTNLLPDSTNFDDGTSWTNTAEFTKTQVSSAVQGETAYKYVNQGALPARSISLDADTATDSNYVLYAILERSNGTPASAISIRNRTDGTHICLVNYAWETDTATVSSGSTDGADLEAQSIQLGTGPNGGALVLLVARGRPLTLGVSVGPLIYVTGTAQNTDEVIIHAAQLTKDGILSSLIITEGAAATVPSDFVSVDLSPWFREAEGTFYVEANVQEDNPNGEDVILGVGRSDYWNFYRMFGSGGGNSGIAQLISRDGGATAASAQTAQDYAQFFRSAISLKGGEGIAISIDGAAPVKDLGAFNLATDKQLLTLGSRDNIGSSYGGQTYIKDVKFYPKSIVLDDAELQYLSANGKLSTEA